MTLHPRLLDVDVERKKVQLAERIIEIEEKEETCRMELNFKSGKLVDGHKYLPILK